MGLSKKSCETAREILIKINPNVQNGYIEEYDKDKEFIENRVLGLDKKSDGSFENIYMNVRDITPGQIEMFEELKHAIPNTSFMRHKMNGITRIGWI